MSETTRATIDDLTTPAPPLQAAPPPALILPPAPWVARRDRDGWLTHVDDAEGRRVLGLVAGRIAAPPEVVRAIEALPLLLGLAREEVAAYDRGRSHFEVGRIVDLRRLLGAIGRRTPPPPAPEA
jgi:hypothetical protein